MHPLSTFFFLKCLVEDGLIIEPVDSTSRRRLFGVHPVFSKGKGDGGCYSKSSQHLNVEKYRAV